MRVILMLFISGLLLSQPNTKNDSTVSSKVDMSEEIKPTVESIVANSQEIKKLEDATNRELQKQLDLMKEIKLKVVQLKKSTKIKQKPIKNNVIEDTVKKTGIKEQQLQIEVEGQVVQWETIERTWLGKFLNGKDILYYPYVVDKDGNKIYLK